MTPGTHFWGVTLGYNFLFLPLRGKKPCMCPSFGGHLGSAPTGVFLEGSKITGVSGFLCFLGGQKPQKHTLRCVFGGFLASARGQKGPKWAFLANFVIFYD